MLRRLMTVLRKTLSLLAFIFICGTNGVSIFAEKPQSDTSEARVNGLPVSAQTTDHLLAEVARREPGFGGMFIGPDGVLRIYLLDESPAIVASAKEAIANVYGDRVQLGRIEALKGRYSFLQLKEWHDAMATVVLELP